MSHLPVFLDIKDRIVLVVGGGEAAARRCEMVLKAGGRVRAIFADPELVMRDAATSDGVILEERAFAPADLEGCALIFVASEDEDLNVRVSDAAKAADIPVNVADR
ncbi:MAG: NAD(P)-dependent oxidoreductase, partial [Rhodospirillales bacterium]